MSTPRYRCNIRLCLTSWGWELGEGPAYVRPTALGWLAWIQINFSVSGQLEISPYNPRLLFRTSNAPSPSRFKANPKKRCFVSAQLSSRPVDIYNVFFHSIRPTNALPHLSLNPNPKRTTHLQKKNSTSISTAFHRPTSKHHIPTSSLFPAHQHLLPSPTKMHFSALAALVSTLSALASATPTPDLPDAEPEKPTVAPLAV